MSLDIYLTDKCTCGHGVDYSYSVNITHNLNTMADKAGVYQVLWHPDENNISKAGQLIDPLERAIRDMKEKPTYYKGFNPSNGWGSYRDFVPWLESLLAMCKSHPEAVIEVSR